MWVDDIYQKSFNDIKKLIEKATENKDENLHKEFLVNYEEIINEIDLKITKIKTKYEYLDFTKAIDKMDEELNQYKKILGI